MVSDSPYEASDLALPPPLGAVIGGAASLLTIGLLTLVEPITHLDVRALLDDLSNLLPGADGATAGVVVFVLFGVILAAFYAASQERVPVKGLAIVALFYGFFLWAVSGRLLGSLFEESLRDRFRAWGWLLGCVAYAMCLAAAAAAVQARRSAAPEFVPAD